MPNKTPAVAVNTDRHGKAAAIALWLAIEKLNAPTAHDAGNYGEPETVRTTRETVAAYLAGYAAASAAARRGLRGGDTATKLQHPESAAP